MASKTEAKAEEGAKRYIVAIQKMPIVTGSNPRTGVDRVDEVRKGDEVWFTDEELGKRLEKGYVFDPDAKTAEEAEQDNAAAEEAEQLTRKQALQKEAGDLGLPTSGTINELTARIAEEREKRADVDQTGERGPDPDAAGS